MPQSLCKQSIPFAWMSVPFLYASGYASFVVVFLSFRSQLKWYIKVSRLCTIKPIHCVMLYSTQLLTREDDQAPLFTFIYRNQRFLVWGSFSTRTVRQTRMAGYPVYGTYLIWIIFLFMYLWNIPLSFTVHGDGGHVFVHHDALWNSHSARDLLGTQ